MEASQIADILDNYPKDWVGTTYANLSLLGRSSWSNSLLNLLSSKTPITTSSLESLGNAEDYFRVSSNFSCVLETHLSMASGINNIEHVFTFGSKAFPYISISMASGGLPIEISQGSNPFTEEELETFKFLGVTFVTSAGSPPPTPSTLKVAVLPPSTPLTTVPLSSSYQGCDAIVCNDVLYILNTNLIPPSEVLVRRKRMAAPFTTDKCKWWLGIEAGREDGELCERPKEEDVNEFLTHLQTMSGSAPSPMNPPCTFTVGLSALQSLWTTFLTLGGVDVLMASTAYGGSSEMTDLMVKHGKGGLRKFKFHVQGGNKINDSVEKALEEMREIGDLKPNTVICCEIPTNPDMKVPEMSGLINLLQEHSTLTGVSVHLVVDTTFAPASGVLEKIKNIDPTLSAMCFISMSKSVSRGLTCAGAIVANDTTSSRSILKSVTSVSGCLDTNAKNDQLNILCLNHLGVEERCTKAYNLARQIGDALVEEVKGMTGKDMALAFVGEEHAKVRFTSSTFSFNLPPPEGAGREELEGLAQKFVDILQEDKVLFKPCVSFGQDNGKTYATVPATSTQGAIKEEDKAKQSVGGVQLTRLSFPVEADKERLEACVRNAVRVIYNKEN
mmetsp:Transcript_8276/g.16710  ORF Transcript_8276/g.16710 Transcript_8276/m.16710 type:complete len:615 (+) Transcript_8276:49-1893(+)